MCLSCTLSFSVEVQNLVVYLEKMMNVTSEVAYAGASVRIYAFAKRNPARSFDGIRD